MQTVGDNGADFRIGITSDVGGSQTAAGSFGSITQNFSSWFSSSDAGKLVAKPGSLYSDLGSSFFSFAPSTITVTGGDEWYFYGDITASGKSFMATLNGQTLFLQKSDQNIEPAGSIQAVPEPSICAMALAGLACGGYSMFRRRRAR
jgi:hypothetical protein